MDILKDILEELSNVLGAFIRYSICKMCGSKKSFIYFENNEKTLNSVIGFFAMMGIAFVIVRVIQFYIAE